MAKQKTVVVLREPRTYWERLIGAYADDKEICNCRQAYYTVCPGGEQRTCAGCYTPGDRSHTYCEYGCSANQLIAKEEIAEKVWKDMEHDGIVWTEPGDSEISKG